MELLNTTNMTNIYDIPDKDAVISRSDLIIVELDNYDTISAASIDINLLIKMLSYLLNNQSNFYKWYTKFSSSVTNVESQYEDLKRSLYFDNDINIIYDQIKNAIDLYEKQIAQKQLATTVIQPRTELKIQTGGELLDIKTFIVGVVKYITGDTDMNKMNINNFYLEYMNRYLQTLNLINIHKKYYSDDDPIIQKLYFNNCYMMLIDIVSYKLSLIMIKKNTTYISKLLSDSTTSIINECGKLIDSENLFKLQNFEKSVFSDVNFSDNKEISKKIDDLRKLYVNMDTDTKQIFNKLTTKNTNIIQQGGNDIISLLDVSGLEKPNQRRIFLIEYDDGTRYAIKLSTWEFPQYWIEGRIYKYFRKIINDKNEPKASIIADKILKSYHFNDINNIPQSNYKVFLTSKLGFIVSNSTNKKLYNAINEIAKDNDVNTIYYYTTENILGDWITFNKISNTLPKEKICSLIVNIFQLLTYLNNKYNFVHWDLHQGNLFINKKDSAMFKIYDFDFSEIALGDNVLINNNIFDAFDEESFRYIDKDRRKNFGFIFDIYRVFYSFTFGEYYTCDYRGLKNLNRLKKFTNRRNPQFQSIEEFNHLYYLFYLSNLLSNFKIKDKFAADKIRDAFNIDKMTGGSNKYYKKYQKYKLKYLDLKNYCDFNY